jgi:hypothetical protein
MQAVEKFYINKKSNLLLFIGGVILCAGSLWFWQVSSQTKHLVEIGQLQFLGVMLTIVFAVAAAVALYRFLDPRPALELSPEALIVRTAGAKAITIPWKHISGFVESRHIGVPMIGIEMHDPEAFLEENNGKGKFTIRHNIKSGMPPVTVPINQLEESRERVLKSLNFYLSDHRKA